jgi:glucose/arabinose dehydrogenase/chitodextrinase
MPHSVVASKCCRDHHLETAGWPFVRRSRGGRLASRIAVTSTMALLFLGLPPGSPASAAGGLVAAYAFDEGSGTAIADASGNGNNGTLSGAGWTSGRYSYGLTFNGSSARVNVPDSASLDLTTAMTLEAWVMPTTVTSAWRDVIYKGNDNYYLMATSSRTARPVGGATISGIHQEATGTAPIAVNTFTHLATTYDGSLVRLFVNGTQVASKAATGSIATSTNQLQIGGDSIYGQYFAGTIDEVRIYDTALTQSQIQADMNSPIGSGSSDTQAPTVPTNLTANAISSTQINLTWTASTDNVGVTGYLIERCEGTGCSNFSSLPATPSGTSHTDTGLTTNTTYRYRVRAIDAASNLSGYSNIASATTQAGGGGPPGLVAAYAFDEGSGTTVADASSNGNTGTISGATWASGRYGAGLSFNGSFARVNVPDSASLDLTTAMTLEAWVMPTTVTSAWRDVIYKGNDNYYLMATSSRTARPVGGATISGIHQEATGTAPIAVNTFTHLATTYDGSLVRLFVNGTQVASKAATGSIATSTNQLQIGGDSIYGQYFAGTIDEVRIYDTALTQSQIQADMNSPIGSGSSDTQAPTAPTNLTATGVTRGEIDVTWSASTDDLGVAGYRIFRNGTQVGTASTYTSFQDIGLNPGTSYTYTVRAFDAAGNTSGLSAPATGTTRSSGTFFQNEVLASGFDLPTNIEFLPDGRMLVVELQGTILVLPPPYTQPDPTPFLQLTNVGSAGVQQGLYDIVLDPNFVSNHYYYVFYTTATPNKDRLSRFTANASLTGTNPGTELVLYQDPDFANHEHHGGALAFGNDGKLYFTTGEHFQPALAQNLSSPRGKLHRINPDGSVPTDNPFFDGAGPNWDSVWARGLRNPFRAYYDPPTGRFYIGDVGGNVASTAIEELDVGARGANYGWPDSEGPCSSPCTSPVYTYAHNGRDASITAGFVYHGSQFPSAYDGSFFLADYAQNWIRRLTFDATGKVNGVYSFEPIDGSADGPTGDVVYMTEGPDGALYYVDLGYSDTTNTAGISKIRRIRFISGGNQPPVVVAAADPTSGPAPLTVTFSSAGSTDADGQTLSYLWTFGDTTTSAAPNPTHTYTQAGQYTARLSVSDGTDTTLSAPITIRVGSPPTATILSPQDASLFRAGALISFSGDASDIEDGPLPASAYTWNIDFLHEGHVHPATPITGVKSGSFTIPTDGHDFSGNTRYRITLTVADSDGLTATRVVTIYPDKANLTFATVPSGLTLYLDGIARTTPFVLDTLIGFTHTVEARDQSSGGVTYRFTSWSDGGAQQHAIVVPASAQSYTATFTTSSPPATPTFVQVNSATPQTNQSTVSVPYTAAQAAGDTNVLAIGWNDATSNITSVTDSAGNAYQVASPTARGSGLSQAIYYAKNIAAAPAGANTVTVTFNAAVRFADIRILEYSGLDANAPLDVGSSGSGTSTLADSGSVATGSASELVFGAGMTKKRFTAAGAGFTLRIITSPDADIAEDRTTSSLGTYNATAPLNKSGAWVMQVATFRAAGQ